jgi:hypothetical protein
MTTKRQAEFMIDGAVHKAADLRARLQMRELPQVAKAILQRASEDATPLVDADGNPMEPAHPADRAEGTERVRIRFRTPTDEHEVIKQRIRASGSSMTAVLEDGLRRYAETGEY